MTVQAALLFLMAAALFLGVVVLFVAGLAALAMWALVMSARGQEPRFELHRWTDRIKKRMKLSSNGEPPRLRNKELEKLDDG